MAEERTNRRLAAVLAADVAGYTRLMEKNTDGTVAAWSAARDDVIDPTIAEHFGRTVKLTGDGFLAEFPTIQDAVNCAIALQTGLASNSLDFRMGINFGDILDDGVDIHGEGINVAARLEGLADPGGICISGDVFNQIRNRIDATYDDLGEKEVKNVSAPVRVYRIVLDSSAPTMKPEFEAPAVAVLPFDNLSGDPEQEYFSDGLTEDIITALSYWRSFPVIARNSTFAYKGKATNARQISEELGASYILEGSVRKAGERIRVTAQLIDAGTGHHLWAKKFDRDLTEIFDLQDELTGAIAATVGSELEKNERKISASKHPKNLDAWDCVNRGMFFFYKFTKEGIAVARDLFEQAITLDPAYSQAHASLAYSHHMDILQGYTSDREYSIEQLMKHASESVSLDAADSFARVLLTFAYRWSLQHDFAVAEARRAVEINPNDVWARATLGNVLDLAGEPEEGLIHLKRALLLNPRDFHNHFFFAIVARANLNNRDYSLAEEWARKSIQENKAQPRAHLLLAAALGHLGKIEEARTALGACENEQPGFARTWVSGREYMKPEDNDHILDGLRKAGLPEI